MMATIIVFNYNNIIIVNNNNYNWAVYYLLPYAIKIEESKNLSEVYCRSDHEISASNFTEDRMCPHIPNVHSNFNTQHITHRTNQHNIYT